MFCVKIYIGNKPANKLTLNVILFTWACLLLIWFFCACFCEFLGLPKI